MTKDMRSDRAQIANGNISSFRVARLGVPFSWNYGQSSCASLGNIVQSGIC